MISKLSIVVLVWLVLAAPAAAASSAAAAYKAVTPLDYTRKILDQARTIVAGNQIKRSRAYPPCSASFSIRMRWAASRSGNIGRALRRHSKGSSCPCSVS